MPETLVMQTTNVTSVQGHCGHVIYLPMYNVKIYQRNHATFYCTTCGSSQSWSGQSDLERLEAQIATVKDQRDTARRATSFQRQKVKRKTRQLAAQKGVTTRIKNRINNGVCPCCNRTFVNLARHMLGQHPNYAGSKK